MTSIPPINARADTEIDIQDSCNCCWGRKIKKKPTLSRSNAKLDLFADQLEKPVRDANEVYNLHVTVNVESPNHSRRSSHGHRNSHDSAYDAASTQSTRSADPDPKT